MTRHGEPLLHLTHVSALATLYSDQRLVALNAAHVEILREAGSELRERGFQLYPAIVDEVVRRFDEAAIDESLLAQARRRGGADA